MDGEKGAKIEDDVAWEIGVNIASMKRRGKLVWIVSVLVLLAGILLLDGRIVAQLRFSGIAHQPSFERDFSRLPTLLPTGKSAVNQIYRGLAHPYGDQEEFVRQLWRTPNRSILGYRFRKEQENLSEDHKQRLAQILSRPDSFHPYLGPKLCGGYHADFAVMLGGDGKERWMLVCLGCGEVLIRSDDGEVICDLEPLAETLLEEIWSEHLGAPYKMVASRLPVPTEVLDSWSFKEYRRGHSKYPSGLRPAIAPENVREQRIYSIETGTDPDSPRYVYLLREETFATEEDANSRFGELYDPDTIAKKVLKGISLVEQRFVIGPRVYAISAVPERGGAELSGMRARLFDHLKAAHPRDVKQFE